MQLNQQMEGVGNGGSEQISSSSVDGQLLVALRKILKKDIELMVISTVGQVIKPVVEDLIRKVVKEEIQSAEKKLLTGGRRSYTNEMTVSKERSLQLKFLDEVSDTVLTGKVLNGKGGNPVRVALVDSATEQVVNCGPESSAKAEILVLDASDDNEHNWNLENFSSRIIRQCDKTKPHFAKSIYIYLKDGVGFLSNAKLGHDSNWMKSCKCRLGARVVENFRGIKVQEAWTESFMVLDSRSKLYEKHYPPTLSDEVWRLVNIARDGPRCKDLNKNNISTVQGFRFLHSVDPQRLEQIVNAGAKLWKATVDHAQTCIIDDKKMYLYYAFTESKSGVVFDAVGGLKGLVVESHYVPVNNLSADQKGCAHKLLLSAFENWKDITSFNDETSLVQQFPHRPSEASASTSSSIQEEMSNGHDLTVSKNIDGYYLGASERQVIIPSPEQQQNNIYQLGSLDTGQIYDPILGVLTRLSSFQFPDLDDINGFASADPGTSSQSISPSVRTFDHPNNIFPSGSPNIGLEQLNEARLDVPNIPSCLFPDHLENINGYAPTAPGTSSQRINPCIRTPDHHPNTIYPFGSLGSIDMEQIYSSIFSVPSCQLHDLENVNGYAPADSSTSSQSISQLIRTPDSPDNFHFGSLGSTDVGRIHCSISGFQGCQLTDLEKVNGYAPSTSSQSITPYIRTPDHPNNIFQSDSLGSPIMGRLETSLDVPRNTLEPCHDNWSLMSVINSGIIHSHRQCNGRVGWNCMLQVVRARKRFLTLGGIHVHKKQKI